MENAKTYLEQGDAFRNQGKWEEARHCYQKVVELEPDNGLAHHHLGDYWFEKKDWEKANTFYKLAISSHSQFNWSYCNLGRSLHNQGDLEEAVIYLEKAVEIDPKFTEAYSYLGDVLLKLEKWEEAISAYSSALKYRPSWVQIYDKLCYGMSQLRQANSQKALSDDRLDLQKISLAVENPSSTAVQIKQNDPELCVELGDALAGNSRLESAIAHYKKALKLQPKHWPAQTKLQEVLERKSRIHKAFKGVSALDSLYSLWLRENLPQTSEIDWMPEIVESWEYKPLISIIVPVYNTPELLLQEMIQSVLDQIYPYWELCLADDASSEPHIRENLQKYAVQDERIKVIFRPENGHISAASNSALELATGEFISLLDHDDLLTPDALYEVVLLLNQHPEADMIYSDEDKMNEYGQLQDPFFKPDWCPDSFLSRMYVCHLGTYRRSIINEIGGFRLGYEGSQDYDLVLRLTEKTNNIFHIPKVLYHWRIHSASAASGDHAKPYAYDAGVKALEDALIRRGTPGKVVRHSRVSGAYTIRYDIQQYKRVSIIIPTRNLGTILDRCLQSIFEKSTYPNYEVILVDNGTDEVESLAVFEAWKQREPQRFQCHRFDIPFNYSRLNNYGVSKASGDYLLFLNNDTEVITADWIEAMVEQAQRPSIGAVGALLLYPDDTVQHAGVVLGIGGVAGHSHKNFHKDDEGYVRQLICTSNYSAVTAACLMCRRQVYEQVAGFNETLKVAFNDIDFCLKIKKLGYNNIYLPQVCLYHYESKSRGAEDTVEKQQRFQQEQAQMLFRWGEIIVKDPCYSPHLSLETEDYSLKIQTHPEVLELSLIPVDNEELWGYHIDFPKLGKLDAGPMVIGGWIVGRSSPVKAIEVLCEGQVIHQTEINTERPDVAQVFPDVTGAEKSGFVTMMNVIGLPQNAELTLQAVQETSQYVKLAKVKICY